jgi:6-phosphogluconolactonase
VAPDHPESNYGMTKDALLNHVSVPDSHVFRIRGEENPQKESSRYSKIIRTVVKNKIHMFPQFDWIFLGLGDDGHTASLFPGADTLREQDKICTVAQHPGTGQKRITLTLPVLNNASRITLLATGISKCKVVKEILQKLNDYQDYPAAMVKPISGVLEWYLDKSAASAL